MHKASAKLTTTIRVELARRNLNQTDLGDALGLSAISVSRRMNGHIDWTVTEVERVAEFLGLPFVELFDVATTP